VILIDTSEKQCQKTKKGGTQRLRVVVVCGDSPPSAEQRTTTLACMRRRPNASEAAGRPARATAHRLVAREVTEIERTSDAAEETLIDRVVGISFCLVTRFPWMWTRLWV